MTVICLPGYRTSSIVASQIRETTVASQNSTHTFLIKRSPKLCSQVVSGPTNSIKIAFCDFHSDEYFFDSYRSFLHPAVDLQTVPRYRLRNVPRQITTICRPPERMRQVLPGHGLFSTAALLDQSLCRPVVLPISPYHP